MSDVLETIFVDTTRYEIGFNSAREVADYDIPVGQGQPRPQKRDENTGYPIWRLSVTMTCREVSERRPIMIQVPSPTKPDGQFDDQIQFGNLVCRPWSNQNGGGQRWEAESFTIGAPPSTGRTATKVKEASSAAA